jgi:hypothetical protein
MKKSWLRGMLLGVSLALLLAGGVALAQGLTVTPDQDCFECYAGNGDGVPDEYEVELTFDGYNPQYGGMMRVMMAGTLWAEGNFGIQLGPPCHGYLWVSCDDLQVHWSYDCGFESSEDGSALGPGAGGWQYPRAEYGQWTFTFWQIDPTGAVIAGPADANFTFAEDCSALEFVPEPGTIALLGSGLAGLAGYAALRWRARS